MNDALGWMLLTLGALGLAGFILVWMTASYNDRLDAQVGRHPEGGDSEAAP